MLHVAQGWRRRARGVSKRTHHAALWPRFRGAGAASGAGRSSGGSTGQWLRRACVSSRCLLLPLGASAAVPAGGSAAARRPSSWAPALRPPATERTGLLGRWHLLLLPPPLSLFAAMLTCLLAVVWRLNQSPPLRSLAAGSTGRCRRRNRGWVHACVCSCDDALLRWWWRLAPCATAAMGHDVRKEKRQRHHRRLRRGCQTVAIRMRYSCSAIFEGGIFARSRRPIQGSIRTFG